MNGLPHLGSHVSGPNLWDMVSGHKTVVASMAVATGLCLIAARVLQQSFPLGTLRLNQRVSVSNEKTQQMMVDGRVISCNILLNPESILKFVSHPQALEYFLEGRRKMAEALLALSPDIECLGKNFPDDPGVQEYVRAFHLELKRVTQPLFPEPYDAILGPFFAFGIGNTQNIQNLEEKKAIEMLQIELFKNSLADYGIGEYNGEILSLLEAFSRNSHLELFSKVVYPFVVSLKEREGNLDHVINHYIGTPPVYDPEESSHHLTGTVAMITERVENDVFAMEEERSSPGEQALDAFLKASPLLHDQEWIRLFGEYYSGKAIVRLFLRLTQPNSSFGAARA